MAKSIVKLEEDETFLSTDKQFNEVFCSLIKQIFNHEKQTRPSYVDERKVKCNHNAHAEM